MTEEQGGPHAAPEARGGREVQAGVGAGRHGRDVEPASTQGEPARERRVVAPQLHGQRVTPLLVELDLIDEDVVAGVVDPEVMRIDGELVDARPGLVLDVELQIEELEATDQVPVPRGQPGQQR